MMPPLIQGSLSTWAARDDLHANLSTSSRLKTNLPGPHAASIPIPGPSAISRTTLSQRFRRAIQQSDLAAAQRVAARAFELQLLPRPFDDTSSELANRSSPQPSRAALRAAEAQRPSSSHPFDVRNVEPSAERNGIARHHHHRKYTLAIHEEPRADASSESEPSIVVAIKNNADVELIRWLIEMGHEQKAPSVDADGNTVLHLSTLYDRPDIIYAYSTYNTSHLASTLADLIDAETPHERRTALHLACIRGYDDVARQLLDLGADVDLQDRAGNTALHFASAWGHLSLVQLLIERGCSLAVQNAEGSTASDYAFSHVVKTALESLGRARHESRKKTRRIVAANTAPSSLRSGVTSSASVQAEETGAIERQARARPFPSFLSRNGSNGGGAKSASTTPIRTLFAEDTGDQTADLYDDWDPEKTFAQPGQDLQPGGRGVLSSPPVHRTASPATFSTPGRPSVDLYSEVLNHSPQASLHSITSKPSWSSGMQQASMLPQSRQVAQSPPAMAPSKLLRSPDEIMMQSHPSRGLSPHHTSDAELYRQPSPNLGPMRRTPSPNHLAAGSAGASADKLKMQDAAAMSLFRSATPQPAQVPGRIDTPPLGQLGRSESPLLLARRPSKANAGARLVPSSGESSSARVEKAGQGPPLLAPIATLPSATHSRSEEHAGSNDGGEASEDEASRLGRAAAQAKLDEYSSWRRDSSPTTPRPDDRETFA
ncbi:FOG: Ankyrin repeat [Moesziomyces antarcticus T-34]|uniref:FOG: Ankyrin repeat n=1 Tax=Pseudozyma antarctica (strain T-34) TaxID=1151754 RepID=M9MDA0_PSEA3|nr:FOG: Ankyrin repeat [Moesziomyces antarcticus T-34]